MNSQQAVFIDAFGTPDVHHLDDSTHFIIVAIVVDVGEVSKLSEKVEAIRKQYFQTGPIKSMKVGDNHARRTEILNALAALNFNAIAIAVDKRRISKDGGLVYKEPFFKFLHKQLFRRLYTAYQISEMKIDTYGREDFMKGFAGYVERQFSGNLFRESELPEFTQSKSSVLIQLADFIAGSLSRGIDGVKSCTEGKEFISILASKLLCIDEWPPNYRPRIQTISANNSNEDNQVRQLCFTLATKYMSENLNPGDDAEKARVEVLTTLLHSFSFIDDTRWMSRPELMERLTFLPQECRNEHYFKTMVIAPLRDKEVILASSQKGYKIPSSTNDLKEFVVQMDRVVHPMLRRLGIARKQISLATKGALDIVTDPRHAYIKQVLEGGHL